MSRRLQPLPSILNLPDEAPVKPDQFLGTLIPVSKATWYRWLKAGMAPPPDRTHGRLPLYRAGTIRAFALSLTAPAE